jgi:hypothetical protein
VEPVDVQTSRLIVRSRGNSVFARLQAPVQFVMQRKMMLGIKRRAEGLGNRPPGSGPEPRWQLKPKPGVP